MDQVRLLYDFSPQNISTHVWINGMMWFLFGNLTILAAALRHIAIMKYLHSITFFITVCFMYGLGIPWINSDLTYPQKPVQDHVRIGIYLIIACAFQLIGGTVLLILRRAVSKNSYSMYCIRKGHLFIGYTTSFLAKASGLYMYYIQLYGTFLLLIFMEAVFISLLIYIKFFRKQMQQGIIHPFEEKSQKIRPIRSLGQLSTHYRDYGIIGNFVYDLSPLKIQHPGGYQIIKSVREKDLDRYMYGMYRSEGLPLVPTNSHTTDSMQMLGTPIAKIQIQSPYLDFSDVDTQCQLLSCRKISNDSFYELCFLPKHFEAFQFNGYSDINQLGRYRSIQVNGVARLYTAVNFLNARNKKIMKNFFPNVSQKSDQNLQSARQLTTPKSMTQLKEIQNLKGEPMPIMIKKYENGTLTPKLINIKEQDKVFISGYKGPGLRLGDILPGKVILVGGGTGCFPYFDLIDLLFKSSLVAFDNKLKKQLLTNNPILQQYLFDKHQFVLFWAFATQDDIHSIILEQLVYLASKSRTIKCYLKIKGGVSLKKDGIKYVNNDLEQLILNEMNTQFSKVLVCGPPAMNQSFHDIFSGNNDIRDKWLIL